MSFSLLVLGVMLQYVQPRPTGLLQPANPARVIATAVRGNAISIIHLGVLLLMLTPLARVLILMLEFFRNREMSFAIISIGVLFLLALSAVIGLS